MGADLGCLNKQVKLKGKDRKWKLYSKKQQPMKAGQSVKQKTKLRLLLLCYLWCKGTDLGCLNKQVKPKGKDRKWKLYSKEQQPTKAG